MITKIEPENHVGFGGSSLDRKRLPGQVALKKVLSAND